MITPHDTQLIIIDIQGKLAEIVVDSGKLIKNVKTLILGCKLLEIPIVCAEQNPGGLGRTTAEILELLSDNPPIPKMTFSAFGEKSFRKALEYNDRKNILIAGIEAHICVYQTSVDLIRNGYNLHLITDAVSSRVPENKTLGITRIKDEGGKLSGTEMVIFELQKTCEEKHFKQLLKLVK